MPIQSMMEGLDGYWGFFKCSQLEWQAIERIITRAIEGGEIPPSYTYGSHHIASAVKAGPVRLTYREY